MYTISQYLCFGGDEDGLKGEIMSDPTWDFDSCQFTDRLYSRLNFQGAQGSIKQLITKAIS